MKNVLLQTSLSFAISCMTVAVLVAQQPTPTTARAGSGAMYKISGLDDEKLRSLINQQVEMQGELRERTLMGATRPTTPGPETRPDEVQEIRAASIKMIASTCTGGTE